MTVLVLMDFINHWIGSRSFLVFYLISLLFQIFHFFCDFGSKFCPDSFESSCLLQGIHSDVSQTFWINYWFLWLLSHLFFLFWFWLLLFRLIQFTNVYLKWFRFFSFFIFFIFLIPSSLFWLESFICLKCLLSCAFAFFNVKCIIFGWWHRWFIGKVSSIPLRIVKDHFRWRVIIWNCQSLCLPFFRWDNREVWFTLLSEIKDKFPFIFIWV